MEHGSKKTGRIFNIQRMSLHDGPGIRTTVFFKGCNLRCFWCHNPESEEYELEIHYYPAKCIGCGECVKVCPVGAHTIDSETGAHSFFRKKCIRCGKCAAVCPSGSLRSAGVDRDVDGLVQELLKDKPFFDHSSGGVTLSGGEPLLQPDFVFELLKKLKELDVHTAVESAFLVPFHIIEKVMPYVDLFIIDLKHPDKMKHLEITGCDNQLIIDNIFLLDQAGANYFIRVPVIPGVNDSKPVMQAINQIVGKLNNIKSIELMPYHPFGISKYLSLEKNTSKQKNMHEPTKEILQDLARSFDSVPVQFRSGANTIWVMNGEVIPSVNKVPILSSRKDAGHLKLVK